ncbi:unnamed protein product [Nippostrongylus brasiliensis]|uniref:GLOBIN domain-containing protein n=1 Tax=Nippostrongylus brasiliensis TaxID=27835 RepID=A0A158QXW5_NIPBR|nr:unnamed protein product [Nippostrongylus brasiliensis]
MDIGCELVARLLNDNRTRFRALIESHSGDVLGSANFSAEDVKKFRRARAVGHGVVVFFNQTWEVFLTIRRRSSWERNFTLNLFAIKRYEKKMLSLFLSGNTLDIPVNSKIPEDLRTAVKAMSETNTRELAEDLAVHHFAVTRHLEQIGRVISELDKPNALDLITEHSLRLGASHFRMKVWFQAENWLCVKNCLLDTIMTALSLKRKSIPVCGYQKAMDTKRGREIWYRVIQFVIQNMKKGFLALHELTQNFFRKHIAQLQMTMANLPKSKESVAPAPSSNKDFPVLEKVDKTQFEQANLPLSICILLSE